MRKHAVFLDLDGTIAQYDRPPSEAVTAAVRRARQAGHAVFLCTGRAPGYIYASVKAVGFDGIVAAAGGHIRLGETLLYRRPLPPALLERILTLYLGNGRTCFLEGEESMYAVNPSQPSGWPEVTGARDFEPGSGRFAGQEVMKFSIYHPLTAEEKRMLSPELAFIEQGDYTEVLPAGVCKSDGMRRVLERLGIPREDSIAIGDSRNDLDMLRYAGVGVAMGGSPEEVIRAADRVTGSLAADGAAAALEELLRPR